MRIIIVDDHPLVRQGLISVLSLEEMIEVVGEAGSREEAVALLIKEKPDIALIDLQLSGDSGLNIIKDVLDKNLPTKFVILTSSTEVEDFMKAVELGVNGYILKHSFPEELVHAIKLVFKGRKFFDPELIENQMNSDVAELTTENLTPKEQEVLVCLGKGLCNKEIAKKLFITEYTVKKHVSQILGKLELSDRTQAALYANTIGIAKYELKKPS